MNNMNIVKLIRSHMEKDEDGFSKAASLIASDLQSMGDEKIASYITDLFLPLDWCINDPPECHFDKDYKTIYGPLLVAEPIYNDILSSINSIKDHSINKFLFYGESETGKTETVKQIARILRNALYIVDYEKIIGSSLEETKANLSELFAEFGRLSYRTRLIIFFDDIDFILMKSTTQSIIEGIKGISSNITVIASTTNICDIPESLKSIFDKTISFNRYSRDDLEEIATRLLGYLIKDYTSLKKDDELFNKILKLSPSLPLPGIMKNVILSSFMCGNISNSYGYLGVIYKALLNVSNCEVSLLKEQGFTIDEIEKLTLKGREDIEGELLA